MCVCTHVFVCTHSMCVTQLWTVHSIMNSTLYLMNDKADTLHFQCVAAGTPPLNPTMFHPFIVFSLNATCSKLHHKVNFPWEDHIIMAPTQQERADLQCCSSKHLRGDGQSESPSLYSVHTQALDHAHRLHGNCASLASNKAFHGNKKFHWLLRVHLY